MSVKSKKMRKAARTAAMSALIVSAIVGTSVVASAAADNVSRINAGTTVSYANNESASALHVNGGTLYVGSNVTIGKDVKGQEVNLGAFGSNKNVWVSGGSLIVGVKSGNPAEPGQPIHGTVTMTVDNMTIDGGLVSVTNSSTLKSAGDIDINGGKLLMTGHYDSNNKPDPDSGSTIIAKNVNVNAGGTLEAAQGLQNLIKTSGAVNLKGGTINVATGGGAALTIGGTSDSFGANLVAGDLYVTTNGKLNSYGGTIKAKLRNAGTTNFAGGTTTVDNMTVEAGTTTISGNATVNVLQDKPEISGGTLEMKGGTLRVAGGAGTLVISGGTLHSSANVNTVDGSIAQRGGTIKADDASTLNITKNLTVSDSGKVTIVGGSTMSVAGTTNLAANSVTVGDGTAGQDFFSITKDSIVSVKADGIYEANSGIAGNAIKLESVSGSATVDGVLIITGWNGTVDATKVASALTGVDGETLTNSLTGNNVILMGAALNGVTAEITTGTNSDVIAYGAAVTVSASTGTTFTNTGTIIVPKLVAGGTVTEFENSTGKTTLVGMGAADSTTTFTKYTQSGSGATTVTGGAGLMAGTLGITDGAVSIEAGSALSAGELAMTGGTLSVLNSTANFGTLKATGGTIFVDPAYVTINSITDGFGAKLLTGAGSVVAIGSANTAWLEKPMTDAGFKFGDTTQAVLGVSAADTIVTDATGGVIIVDPTVTNAGVVTRPGGGTDLTAGRGNLAANNTGAFFAGAGSLTVLDVAALDGDAVFDFNSTTKEYVNIVNGAKLHIANLTVKGVQVFENTGTGGSIEINDGLTDGGTYNPDGSNAGWAGNNLIQPDRMLTNVRMSADGKLTADAALASNALGMSHEFNDLMGGVWGNALNNTNSGSAGIRFVSRAASTDYGLSTDQAAKTIEGAAQMGAVAGVQGVTMGAANAATSAVATRTSFAQPLMDKTKAVAMHVDTDGSVSLDSGLNAGNGMKNGFALWIMPLYQSNNVWGMDAGSFKSGYSSDLGGVALGADYTINDMFRFGAALNIGAGYSESSGDFNSTDNSFNFWGINLYGGWTMNNFGVTADVGYTGNYNKVEQEVPMALQVPNLKSDINSSAWTAGVKAEYKFETSVMDIIPHVGVRYMGLTTDEYSVKGGGTVFKVDQDHQTIWTFPIGVTLSKTMDTGSGWAFKPQLDLAVIPAAGDVEARSKSRIPGAPGSAEAKMQIVDYVTFDGGVGFDFSNENLSFGLNYNIQASEHRTGHGVFGTVRYEF